MTPGPIESLEVGLDFGPHGGGPTTVGRLEWSRTQKRAAFQYDPSFLERGLDLSPLGLRPTPELTMAGGHPFEGLHGVFADSLPDGWGRLLLDRVFGPAGRGSGSPTPLDRLAMIGRTGMGALTYTPQTTRDGGFHRHDLDWFAATAAAIQSGSENPDVEAMFQACGGSAGARPKVMVVLDGGEPPDLRIDDGRPLGEGAGSRWLVKFASRGDAAQAGRVEQAYATMARDAGIEVAPTRLLEGRRGVAYFATRRFDRDDDGSRRHVQTLAAIVGSDFRVPALDYDDLMKATRLLTSSQDQVDAVFARMAFNVLAGNRDDHEKNHAFAMDGTGTWRLTPAYDITPSDGLGGEHAMSVSGEGRRPGLAHMRALGAKHGVARTVVDETVERTLGALSRWREHARDAGLGRGEGARMAARLAAHASAAAVRPVQVPAPSAPCPRRDTRERR